MKEYSDFFKKHRFFGKIICIALSFLIVCILEVIAHFVPVKEDVLEQALDILQEDPELFWKQRANMNRYFQGVDIQTNSLGMRDKPINREKEADLTRIVCLGASPTFGWGVTRMETYPYQLEQKLKRKFNNKKLEVINAGIIGYSSYQGMSLLKNYILKLAPDSIIVSYGVNDIDKYRFYRNNGKSDKELKCGNRLFINFKNFLYTSRLFKTYRKIMLSILGVNGKFFGRPTGIYPEKRRVPPDDYRSNLNSICAIARHNNIKIVFVKMPMRTPFSIPDMPLSLQYESARHIVASLAFANVSKYDEAINEAKNALIYNPYSSKAAYYLGSFYRKKRLNRIGEIYFQRAKEIELAECAKINKEYNDIMEQVAETQGAPIVDIPEIFEQIYAKNGTSLFINYFHDFVHPNVTGHAIISSEIYNILLKYSLIQ